MANISRKSCVLVAVALIAGATLVSAGEATTVGDFLVSLAGAAGLDASSQTAAQNSLRDAGWGLPDLNLGAMLTEGDVVAIAASGGLKVTTSTPQASFDQSRVQSFLTAFGPTINAEGAHADSHPAPWDHGADPRTKGKGKKKGLYKSPSKPV
jgi:hypothetical protein